MHDDENGTRKTAVRPVVVVATATSAEVLMPQYAVTGNAWSVGDQNATRALPH